MIGLDRLMKTKGVVAAGQFAEDGTIIRTVGDLPGDVVQSAEPCARQNRAAMELLSALDQRSERDWQPLVGWVVWGGYYSVVAVGNTRVFVETTRADINQLFVDLIGAEATGPRQMNY